MRKQLIILYAITITFLCACNNAEESKAKESPVIENEDMEKIRELEPEEYTHYIEDRSNGLIQEKQFGDLIFSVQYKPVEYLVIQNVLNDIISLADYETLKDELDDAQYYTFRIASAEGTMSPLKFDLKNMQEYDARIKYFAFNIKNDFSLVDGTDTLKCSLLHFERTYELTPYNTFTLTFDDPNNKPDKGIADKTLIYDDKTFGLGTVKLKIRKEDLNNIPDIKLL